MIIGIDRTALYEGESIHYQVMLSDADPIDPGLAPDLSAFADFDVKILPKQTQLRGGSSFRVVINNREVRDESTPPTHAVVFTYILTPRRSGSLVVPLPKIESGGRALLPTTVKIGDRSVPGSQISGAIPVSVQAPEEQDTIRMEITVDRDRLYPLQPLTVTLTLWIKELPGQRFPANPFFLPDGMPPQLTIPWLQSDETLPKGLTPKEGVVDGLNALLVSGRRGTARGFAINNYGEERLSMGFDDMFASPMSSRSLTRFVPYRFSPTPTPVKRPDAAGQEATYWEYRFSRTFLPDAVGRYEFGPVLFKGIIENPDATTKPFFAAAKPVAVEVLDVPKENRPASYIGAFGTFDWTADIQPRKAKVGDPLILTLRLAGEGSTTGIEALDLSKNPEVDRLFRVHHPPTERVDGASCTFSYTIRPKEAGQLVFPSISATFFDVAAESFVTRTTEPMTIEVEAASRNGTASVYSNSRSGFSGELERSEQGLFANMTSPSGASRPVLDFTAWSRLMISLVVGYLVLALGVTLWRRRGAGPAVLRRRGALSRARQRLAELPSAATPTERLARLQGALFGFVADVTDSLEDGMTSKDACWKLLERGVDRETVAEVRGLLETLDGARFGGLDPQSLDDLAETGSKLLERVGNG